MASARKNTIKLRALMGFSYASKRREPGDEFRAESRDARLLIAAGRAEKVEPVKRKQAAPPPQDPPAGDDPSTESDDDANEGDGGETPPAPSEEAGEGGLFSGEGAAETDDDHSTADAT